MKSYKPMVVDIVFDQRYQNFPYQGYIYEVHNFFGHSKKKLVHTTSLNHEYKEALEEAEEYIQNTINPECFKSVSGSYEVVDGNLQQRTPDHD